MSNTVRDMFRSLEATIHERLEGIQEMLLNRREAQSDTDYDSKFENIDYNTKQLIMAIRDQNAKIEALQNRIAALGAAGPVADALLPLRPMEGIEVVPKREVVLEAEPLSFADRLLLNTRARKALEAEEMGDVRTDSYPLNCADEDEDGAVEDEDEAPAVIPVVEDTVHVVSDEDEAEADDGAEAEDAEDAEDEIELEEFEYKGSTYYRDTENNVYMTDEDGEVNLEASIGVWNAAKQRIVVNKN